MTHTLHRHIPTESLDKDYVVLVALDLPYLSPETSSKMKRASAILWKHNPVNMGQSRLGSIKMRGITYELLYDKIGDHSKRLRNILHTTQSILHAVYNDIKSVKNVINDLKNIGIAVIVSGRFDEVFKMAKDLNIMPHSYNLSLGLWGKTDKLPQKKELQIISLCGHGMVNTKLVRKVANDVKEGRSSLEQAANELAGCCVCGAFNPVVASKLIKEIVEMGSNPNNLSDNS